MLHYLHVRLMYNHCSIAHTYNAADTHKEVAVRVEAESYFLIEDNWTPGVVIA